jgi:hypothetical protein
MVAYATAQVLRVLIAYKALEVDRHAKQFDRATNRSGDGPAHSDEGPPIGAVAAEAMDQGGSDPGVLAVAMGARSRGPWPLFG